MKNWTYQFNILATEDDDSLFVFMFTTIMQTNDYHQWTLDNDSWGYEWLAILCCANKVESIEMESS